MIEMADSDLAIGYDYFTRLKEIVDFSVYKSTFLLTDNVIFELYADKIRRIFDRELAINRYLAIPSGEENKSLATVEKIARKMLDSGIGHDSVLVAMGGGTVCEIGGLSACLYRHGIDYINLPTTLVGQVDASLGGDCAVNLGSERDIIGLVSRPRKTVVDPGFLDTLSREQIKDGMAVMLKIAAAADSDLFGKLESIRCELIGADDSLKLELIERAARLKLAVTARDLHERGYRKILDFGQTTGRALEPCENNRDLTYGRALAIGMLVEIELSDFVCGLGPAVKARIKTNIKTLLRGSAAPNIKGEELWVKIQYDDRFSIKEVKFTLLEDIGIPRFKAVFKDQFLTAYNTVCRELWE